MIFVCLQQPKHVEPIIGRKINVTTAVLYLDLRENLNNKLITETGLMKKYKA